QSHILFTSRDLSLLLMTFPPRRSSDLPPERSFSARPISANTHAQAASPCTAAASTSTPASPSRADHPVRNAATLNATAAGSNQRSEEHTSEVQSRGHLVCRLLR